MARPSDASISTRNRTTATTASTFNCRSFASLLWTKMIKKLHAMSCCCLLPRGENQLLFQPQKKLIHLILYRSKNEKKGFQRESAFKVCSTCFEHLHRYSSTLQEFRTTLYMLLGTLLGTSFLPFKQPKLALHFWPRDFTANQIAD